MSITTSRWAALVWVAALGCYSDRSQQSTLPDGEFAGGGAGASTVSPGVEPGDPGADQGQYVGRQPGYAAGPPGGGMDPGSRYAPGGAGQNANDNKDNNNNDNNDNNNDDEDNVARGDAPVALAPDGAVVIQPRGPMPQLPAAGPDDDADGPGDGGDGGDQVAAADVPAGATADVSDAEIGVTLGGYGQWIETDDYGQVWRPDATVVGVDFTPYESGGSWQDSDAGWAFSCDYSWGWLPFHYGRWAWFNDYWGWVPGHRWGAAWVDWRNGNGVVGWRPRPPGHGYHHNGHSYDGGGSVVRDHRHPTQHDSNWRFATTRDFTRPHIRSHLYGNPAEGMRVTSRVAAPPLRARTTVHAGDLMRGRYATGNRVTNGASNRGWSNGAVVRDHRDARDAGRGRNDDRPSGGDAPAARGYPPAAAVRGYPSNGERPGAPSGSSVPAGSSGGDYAPGRGYGGGRVYNQNSGSNAGRFGGGGGNSGNVVRDHRGSSPSPSGGYRPPPAAAPFGGGPHSGGGSSGSHSGGGSSGSHSGGGSSGGGSHSSGGNSSSGNSSSGNSSSGSSHSGGGHH